MMDERVRGNGSIKTENRNVGSFEEIEVGGNIDVYFTQGPAGPVRIETDDNLLGLIETETNGDRLVIRVKDDFNIDPTRDNKVYVSAPAIDWFDASGACSIRGENKITSSKALDIHLSGASHADLDLNAPAVDADLSGACKLNLRGETKDLTIDGSGATRAKCYDLKAENVDIDISGAGDVETFASVKLNVRVSGAGNVKYKGNPTVNQSVSGAGSVNKVE